MRLPALVAAPLLLLASAQATTVEIHYAPVENLEAIDVDLINQAGVSIDMAAYVLSDSAVIEALGDAADRGVAVRIYLDRGEYPAQSASLSDLFTRQGVEPRLKVGGALMHMKAYAVDRSRLRTGSGNFSRSGLSRQDNDLIVTDNAEVVARFEQDFEAIWAKGVRP